MTANMRRSAVGGFTLIELMVVVAVISVILTLAVPSFNGMLARKRLEGAAQELGTDLQYARSEAVARNIEVRVATNAVNACYTVFVWRGAGTCTCTPAVSCTLAAAATDPTALKTVDLAGTGVTATADVFRFEPLRGMLADAADHAVTLSSSAGPPWQLSAAVNAVGRASTCSPSGSVKGYPSC